MPRTQKPPLFFDEPKDDREFVRKVSLIVRELLEGKINSIFDVTLVAGATKTEFLADRISVDSGVFFSPLTASGAAALGSGLYAVPSKGKVTLFHDADPGTDRRLRIAVLG